MSIFRKNDILPLAMIILCIILLFMSHESLAVEKPLNDNNSNTAAGKQNQVKEREVVDKRVIADIIFAKKVKTDKEFVVKVVYRAKSIKKIKAELSFDANSLRFVSGDAKQHTYDTIFLKGGKKTKNKVLYSLIFKAKLGGVSKFSLSTLDFRDNLNNKYAIAVVEDSVSVSGKTEYKVKANVIDESKEGVDEEFTSKKVDTSSGMKMEIWILLVISIIILPVIFSVTKKRAKNNRFM